MSVSYTLSRDHQQSLRLLSVPMLTCLTQTNEVTSPLSNTVKSGNCRNDKTENKAS